MTFAHYASAPHPEAHPEWIPLLAQHGADLDIRPPSEISYSTPSTMACSLDQPEVLLQLIHHGANCALPDLRGNSCIHTVVINSKNKAALPVAIENRCGTVNGLNNIGVTALSLAAARSNATAVTLLLDAGADPTIRNHVGDLPIDTWLRDPHGPVYERLKAATEERLASNVSANQ